MTNHDEIVKQFCGNIEDRIRSCRSKTVAGYLKRILLQELKKYSADEIIHRYFEKKYDELVECYFDNKGCNKLIEK
jgi:vacuolar-type H+-ATPase subunit E/Vma4